jgi:hypothetical protein
VFVLPKVSEQVEWRWQYAPHGQGRREPWSIREAAPVPANSRMPRCRTGPSSPPGTGRSAPTAGSDRSTTRLDGSAESSRHDAMRHATPRHSTRRRRQRRCTARSKGGGERLIARARQYSRIIVDLKISEPEERSRWNRADHAFPSLRQVSATISSTGDLAISIHIPREDKRGVARTHPPRICSAGPRRASSCP